MCKNISILIKDKTLKETKHKSMIKLRWIFKLKQTNLIYNMLAFSATYYLELYHIKRGKECSWALSLDVKKNATLTQKKLTLSTLV